MSIARTRLAALPALLLFVICANAAEPANGTATIRVDDSEYTIPIVCDDTSRPESGVFTEPQRVTRERTGRASAVRLTIRPWQDPAWLVVSLDRYVAWLPMPSTGNGILELELAMSPASYLHDNSPVALTIDDWQAGNRPEGLAGVRIAADCNHLDPGAPAFRKLTATD